MFPVAAGGRQLDGGSKGESVLPPSGRISKGIILDWATNHARFGWSYGQFDEQGWNRQVIERQLAHAERNAVSAAYNFAEHLPERRKMMEAWADYLDSLKAGAEVIPLFKRDSSIARKTKGRLRVSKSRLA